MSSLGLETSAGPKHGCITRFSPVVNPGQFRAFNTSQSLEAKKSEFRTDRYCKVNSEGRGLLDALM